MIVLAALAATLALGVTSTAWAGEVEPRLPRVRGNQPQPVCLCAPAGAVGAALAFGTLPKHQAGAVTGPLVITGHAYVTYQRADTPGVWFTVEAQCSMLPQGRVATYPLGVDPVVVPLGDLGPGEGRGVSVETWRAR